MTTRPAKPRPSVEWIKLSAKPSAIAKTALPMILERDRWIHRQVETLTILDADRMLRHVSVDLTVPKMEGLSENDPETVYLPIALLRREVMENFDLRDEEGAALPCLTAAQHDEVVQSMLAGATLGALVGAGYEEPDKDDDVQQVLELVRSMTVRRSLEARRKWTALRGRRREIKQCILANEGASALIEDLRDQFPLFVPLRASAGDRRVLKFSLEVGIARHSDDVASLGKTPRRRRSRSDTLLARPWPLIAETPIAGRADSVHIEIPAPEELFVASASLDAIGGRRKNIVAITKPVPVAHLHPITVPKRGTDVELTVHFVLRRDGLATAGMLLASTTTALLAAGLGLHLIGVAPRADAAGAVVVALPAIYAPILAISSAHRLVRRIVSGARTLMLLSAGISFAAAGSLGVGLPANDRAWLWLALLLASLPPTLLLAWAWIRAPRGATR